MYEGSLLAEARLVIGVLILCLIAVLSYEWRAWQLPLRHALSTKQAVEQISSLTQSLMLNAQSSDSRAGECEDELLAMRANVKNMYIQIEQLQHELSKLTKE